MGGRGTARLTYPQLPKGPRPDGEFEVRVKYTGAFSDSLGEMSTIYYERYPLDVEIVNGHVGVFKFSLGDVERFKGTLVPFVGGAYLDNKNNLAWMLHLTGGTGGGRAPVHRNPDVDELRYFSMGPQKGNFQFTPHGVDHGWGRGYTKQERNSPAGPYDVPDVLSAYTGRPLKGTPISQQFAMPSLA